MGDVRTGTGGDRCVCCGEIIPEGRQVCPVCFGEIMINKEEATCASACGTCGARMKRRLRNEQGKRGEAGRSRV